MAMILDAEGKPITSEIATIRKDPLRVFYGGVQYNEDDTLKSRGGAKGLKIYSDLKRDAHAGAVLAKRKLAVTSRTWQVQPASQSSQDKAAADTVTAALKHLRFNSVCKRLLEATLMGYAVSEVMWEVRDGLVLPRTVKARAPQRFLFGADDEELRLITRENMLQGEAMPARKFIVHRRGADDDNPYGQGLGSTLFWPVFFKRQGITFWLTFADKFGSPTAVGKYPSGAGKSEQNKLLAALQAISQDAGVIIPEGMAIDLLEAARTGSVDTYEKLVRYMDEQISKAVLGETMSTTAASTGLGSNQAGVQNDVRLEVAKDDSDELCEALNDTLVRWIVEFNHPGAGLPELERDFDQAEDTAKLAERDSKLVQMGWEPSEQYIQETYGEGWTRRAPAQTPPALAGQEPGAGGADPAGNTADDPADPQEDAARFAEGAPLATGTAQRAFNKARQQQLVSGAEQLAADYAEVLRGPLEDITAQLEASGDLTEFRSRLTALLNRKPDPALVNKLAEASFASHVMGRGLAPKKPGLVERLKAAIKKRV